MKVLARAVGVLAAAGAVVVAVALPAAAHAVLESTTPAAGSVVPTSPREVTLRFGEDVQITPADIRVYDDHLHRVDEADAGHITGRGDTVGVHLHSGLPDGTYTVTYRVISADSHPVAGGFVFSIGHASKVQGVATGLGGGSKPVGISLGAARFVNYLGMVLVIGGLAILWLWPAGRRDKLARRVPLAGLLVLFVGTVAAFFLQAPYAAGEGFSAMFDHRILSTVLHSNYGFSMLMRLAVVVVGLAAYPFLIRRRGWLYGGGVVVLGAALGFTFAHAGHASVHDNHGLAPLADAAHILAASAWLGGLVMIAGVVMRRAPGDLRTALPRFSAMAVGCITVIAGTGVYQAIRNVGSWAALLHTTYGVLVLAKIGGAVLILGLGFAARQFVIRHYIGGSWYALPRIRRLASDGPGTLAVDAPPAPPTTGELSILRRGLLAEIATGVAILAITAVLVDTIQAKTAYAAPVSRTIVTSNLRLDVEVDPAKTGPAVIHLYAYTPVGQLLTIQKISGSLTLPARDVGPLPVPFTVAGPGHALADLSLEAPGTWQLVMTVQTSPIDAYTVQTTFPVH